MPRCALLPPNTHRPLSAFYDTVGPIRLSCIMCAAQHHYLVPGCTCTPPVSLSDSMAPLCVSAPLPFDITAQHMQGGTGCRVGRGITTDTNLLGTSLAPPLAGYPPLPPRSWQGGAFNTQLHILGHATGKMAVLFLRPTDITLPSTYFDVSMDCHKLFLVSPYHL